MVSTQPAFGYNGNYLGGVWEIDHDSGRPKSQFTNTSLRDGRRLNVVTSLISKIKKPTEQLVFTSVRPVVSGTYNIHDDTANGANLALPHILADHEQWELLSHRRIEAKRVTMIPLGRYNGMPVIGYADGHVNGVEPRILIDQQLWIPNAQTVNDIPASEFSHSY